MKKLYIARHAKSDWGLAGYSDFDRPLNAQGLLDAPAMARYLYSKNIKVDIIVSSSAMRALTTARCYADQISSLNNLTEADEIYQADDTDMLNIIHSVSDEADSLMLVGHNPTFSTLVGRLSGKMVNMSAGSVVELSVECDSWSDVSNNSAQIVKVYSPKDI